jgi:hypothetical protein
MYFTLLLSLYPQYSICQAIQYTHVHPDYVPGTLLLSQPCTPADFFIEALPIDPIARAD